MLNDRLIQSYEDLLDKNAKVSFVANPYIQKCSTSVLKHCFTKTEKMMETADKKSMGILIKHVIDKNDLNSSNIMLMLIGASEGYMH